MNTTTYMSPLGPIVLKADTHALTDVYFSNEEIKEPCHSPLLDDAVEQLDHYFRGKRRKFDIPLHFQGTVFQNNVYEALLTVEYATVATYKDIAQMIGKPKAYRAVGMANNKNRIAIIVPCHRIIGSDGSLVGYRGGLSIKQALLELEQSFQTQNKRHR